MALESDGWVYKDSQITPDELALGEYAELKDSGDESIDQQTATATRIFIVNHADRIPFYDSLLGWGKIVSGNAVRVHPDAHPEFPFWYCTDVEKAGAGSVGIDPNLDIIMRKYAVIKAEYSPLPYPVGDDGWDYFSFRYEKTMEFLNIEQQIYYASDLASMQVGGVGPPGPETIGAYNGKHVSFQTLYLTWHRVPGNLNDPYNQPVIDQCLTVQGLLNQDPMVLRPSGATHDPGTVLFQCCKDTMIPNRAHQNDAGQNQTTFDLEFQFKIIDNGPGYKFTGGPISGYPTTTTGSTAGHNYRYTPKTDKWMLVTFDGKPTGTTIYQSGDLKSLFKLS